MAAHRADANAQAIDGDEFIAGEAENFVRFGLAFPFFLYAEIYVTETLWPDFRRRHLLEAVLAYQKRERRYGGIRSAAAVIGAE
jgi:hypothetical protein